MGGLSGASWWWCRRRAMTMMVVTTWWSTRTSCVTFCVWSRGLVQTDDELVGGFERCFVVVVQTPGDDDDGSDDVVEYSDQLRHVLRVVARPGAVALTTSSRLIVGTTSGRLLSFNLNLLSSSPAASPAPRNHTFSPLHYSSSNFLQS